jgi:hypothetical protein
MGTENTNAEYLTPPQAAKVIGTDHKTVLHWINSGELSALNLAKNKNGRPRYKISRDSIEAFRISRTTGNRSAIVSDAPQNRTRARSLSNVKQFY